MRNFMDDLRAQDAPPLPTTRPSTKQEVWARFHFIYHDVKTPAELKIFCRDAWVWYYVSAVNFEGWDKQPDWVEGDPVFPEAVPENPFLPGHHFAEVERLYQLGQRLKKEASCLA